MYFCDKDRKANIMIVNGILRTRSVLIGSVEKTKAFTKTTREDEPVWGSKRSRNATQKQLANIERIASCRYLQGGKNQAMVKLGEGYHERWQHIWERSIAFEKGKFSSNGWKMYDDVFYGNFGRLIGRYAFTTSDGPVSKGSIDCISSQEDKNKCKTTAKGNLRLGLSEMKKGDLVCIIYACKLPVILRKDARYYTFIGPAYLHGAMSGEFVTDKSKKAARFWIL
ncbi:hypothetical protein CC78DRAFT_576394 [Lojkania enalia]|uniref:Uncharacterized protein n=1 Tax=Lojkania enalia TaxID=147567 RepID=A0A9P4KGY4_9PLEO|nr:hypothetical protein CC78DRAFT_576394 [Didymosphaeria enalia]